MSPHADTISSFFSMENVTIDCESSCKQEMMFGEFGVSVPAILVHTDNAKKKNSYYDYISAFVTSNLYNYNSDGESNVDSFRRKMKSTFGSTTPAQMIYEDIKFWNSIASTGSHVTD